MDHILRDSNGRPIGKITVTSDGKLEGRDANGRLKGKYNPKDDRTYDSNGRLVGNGNLLATLISSTLAV